LKTYEFLVDEMPFGYVFNFENYLFNKIQHIGTQGVKDRIDFFIINNIKRNISGKIHFLLKDGVAYSPFKSLFGSLEFNNRVPPDLIFEFWQFIEQKLRKRNVHTIRITNFAECYAPKRAEIIDTTLRKSGYICILKAVNQHIPVDEQPLTIRMHPMEKKRLRKCKRNGFLFAKEPLEHTRAVFSYLHYCRKEQGLDISIDLEKFLNYTVLFPKNYFLFSVKNQDELVAATIAVRVHRRILYTFVSGSQRKYRQFSPTTMLNNGVYDYCQSNKMRIMDLGISTEQDGTDQHSLITFKERMGCEKSFKHFYSKTL
jgi:hypothetical protein